VYRLTDKGRRRLREEAADWERRSAAIRRLLSNES
jgi:DNA-binding PadR family transcriptional regulator